MLSVTWDNWFGIIWLVVVLGLGIYYWRCWDKGLREIGRSALSINKQLLWHVDQQPSLMDDPIFAAEIEKVRSHQPMYEAMAAGRPRLANKRAKAIKAAGMDATKSGDDE